MYDYVKYGWSHEHPDGSIEQVRACFARLYGCCWESKGPNIDPDDIAEIVHLSKDYPAHDSTVYGVLKLSDGRFLAFEEWCDYTGHG